MSTLAHGKPLSIRQPAARQTYESRVRFPSFSFSFFFFAPYLSSLPPSLPRSSRSPLVGTDETRYSGTRRRNSGDPDDFETANLLNASEKCAPPRSCRCFARFPVIAGRRRDRKIGIVADSATARNRCIESPIAVASRQSTEHFRVQKYYGVHKKKQSINDAREDQLKFVCYYLGHERQIFSLFLSF